MVPVVSTFISFPAGILKLKFRAFLAWTVAGSFVWSTFLTFLGWKVGTEWEGLHVYFSRFSWAILFLIIVVVAWWVWRHFRRADYKQHGLHE